MMLIESTKLPLADRGYIYFAEMTIDGDTFIKIGYSRNPNRRFLTDEFDDVEATIKFKNIIPMLDWMYDFAEGNPSSDYWERQLHNVLRRSEYHYTPDHEFSGITECYKLDTVGYKAAIDYLEENLQDMAPALCYCIQY